jgi:hypothetical protein
MSEYWKSTASYWCKHCNIYVRDTKLARSNHEATAKHQGAVKRALNTLHKDHERGERESERAKREIERLNGVVSGRKDGEQSLEGTPTERTQAVKKQAGQADRQRQLEQLAELGVSIPETFRGGLAMAGEWTITSTRVIDDPVDGSSGTKTKSTGVRKRETEPTEEEREEENAIKGLFKKQKRWGRDSKALPTEEDADLDALLGGSLAKPVKKEEEIHSCNLVKPDVDETARPDAKAVDGRDESVKQELGIDSVRKDLPVSSSADDSAPPAPVFFKKRKHKAAQR